MVIGLAVPVLVNPPGLLVTLYWNIGVPPKFTGGVNATTALVTDDILAVRLVGGCGTSQVVSVTIAGKLVSNAL
jgi:hypothetical protein